MDHACVIVGLGFEASNAVAQFFFIAVTVQRGELLAQPMHSLSTGIKSGL